MFLWVANSQNLTKVFVLQTYTQHHNNNPLNHFTLLEYFILQIKVKLLNMKQLDRATQNQNYNFLSTVPPLLRFYQQAFVQ